MKFISELKKKEKPSMDTTVTAFIGLIETLEKQEGQLVQILIDKDDFDSLYAMVITDKFVYYEKTIPDYIKKVPPMKIKVDNKNYALVGGLYGTAIYFESNKKKLGDAYKECIKRLTCICSKCQHKFNYWHEYKCPKCDTPHQP